MSRPILHAEGVTKQYRVSSGTLEVLRGVTMGIERGELCFILGRSGSGKSTLLHILGGLDEPTQGTVFIEDVNVHELRGARKAAFLNKKIGFVFQFYYLIPELTVRENVMLPGLVARMGRKTIGKKVDGLLDIVGLADRATHVPSQLSGGELQRAALARALVNDPDIVLCDEPTGNLDEENATKVFELLHRLNKTERQTFCIVTHEESLVKGEGNVYRLKEGLLVDSAPKN